MGTELQVGEDILKKAGIINYGSSISQRELSEFRAWIGVRVEALLDGYWDKKPSDHVKAEILADWMASLQTFTPDEIRTACREYLKGPDCARKPKPGDICAIINCRRADALRNIPKPKEATPVMTETIEERRAAAARIMASFGKGNQ